MLDTDISAGGTVSASLSSAGKVISAATFTAVLGAAVLSASGNTGGVHCSLSATLGAAVLSAHGSSGAVREGNLSVALNAATISATGVVSQSNVFYAIHYVSAAPYNVRWLRELTAAFVIGAVQEIDLEPVAPDAALVYTTIVLSDMQSARVVTNLLSQLMSCLGVPQLLVLET